jgi:hypothetical protein
MSGESTQRRSEFGLAATRLERQGDSWCIVALVEGVQRVISRHPTRELGELAFDQYRTGSWPSERRSEHRP